MTVDLHPALVRVTERIRQRSAAARADYLALCQRMRRRPRGSDRMGCANVAHAIAALPANDKLRIVAERAPHFAVVTAYNDMLSAHQPYAEYPDRLREAARQRGATLQVAGGVPAMCDGVTQGEPGMELSLFSRDTIARGTAVALSHDVFDGALLLGVCDKIVPGLLIGALHFGHLPCIFIPAGPMASGLSNKEKAQIRERAAQGEVGRDALLAAESAAYHGAGTCTFYGTANSNQMLLEAMGLQVPGSAFVHPHDPLRDALTHDAVGRLMDSLPGGAHPAPLGEIVDERCIVNAMVALLATGGSTNHLIHWVAVARAAGLTIDWSDFDALSEAVPLLARVYPNGAADVNQFQEAGGPAWVLRELLHAGLLHADVMSVAGRGLEAYTRRPVLLDGAGGPSVAWKELPTPVASPSPAPDILRPANDPHSPVGGLKLLDGNLGRAVIKVSAVPADRHIVEAPARVFDSQEALQQAFRAGELERDMVAVVRFQGPQANGMPELHKLTPPLAVLQKKGFRVALVTDGRMSGASGAVPAAIHVSPEAAQGGALSRLQDGDMIRLDAERGTLNVLLDAATWASRVPAPFTATDARGMGRELFAAERRCVRTAEEGATSW